MEFTIEIKGVSNLQAKLNRLERTLLDWGDAMAAIGKAYQAYFSSVPFASRGTIYGSKWPDLNPAYKSWKAKKFPGRPMLIRTGKMADSFTFRSTRNDMRLSNTAPYFEKHQKGEGVPQRIVMALTEERRKAAIEILSQELSKKVKAA